MLVEDEYNLNLYFYIYLSGQESNEASSSVSRKRRASTEGGEGEVSTKRPKTDAVEV